MAESSPRGVLSDRSTHTLCSTQHCGGDGHVHARAFTHPILTEAISGVAFSWALWGCRSCVQDASGLKLQRRMTNTHSVDLISL